jgi:ABC-2 type transport system ATP-binding protein
MAEVLAAQEVRQRFGAVEALKGVTFTAEGRGVLGVLGPNGAGKTTLLEILQGLRAPSGGAVRLFGQPLSLRHYPRRRIGVVMQREFVLDGVTAGEYAALFSAIYGVRHGRDAVLARARLQDRAGVSVARLSGGEAQRLFIAAASAHRPELLFLDEPTTNLDPESKREIGALLREIGAEATVLLTTHDLREAEAVCDRALFLVDGQVKAQGTVAELAAAVPGATLGRGALEDAFFHFCARRLTAGGGLA